MATDLDPPKNQTPLTQMLSWSDFCTVMFKSIKYFFLVHFWCTGIIFHLSGQEKIEENIVGIEYWNLVTHRLQKKRHNRF